MATRADVMQLTSIEHGWRNAQHLSFSPVQPEPDWVPFTYTVNRPWPLTVFLPITDNGLGNKDTIEITWTETIT